MDHRDRHRKFELDRLISREISRPISIRGRQPSQDWASTSFFLSSFLFFWHCLASLPGANLHFERSSRSFEGRKGRDQGPRAEQRDYRRSARFLLERLDNAIILLAVLRKCRFSADSSPFSEATASFHQAKCQEKNERRKILLFTMLIVEVWRLRSRDYTDFRSEIVGRIPWYVDRHRRI